MTCVHCQEDARCKGYRPRKVVGLLGEMRIKRHYYHCEHCGGGHFPQDQRLGLSSHALTPAAEEVTALAGVLASFAEAAEKTLPKMSGLRLSESTVERITEGAGQRVGSALQEGQTFGQAKDWDWHKDKEGQTCAYVSVDATGVGQQGPGGVEAEGRMVWVGMIYNPIPKDRQRWAKPQGRRPDWQARYVTNLSTLSVLADPLRRQAAQVGMERADRWIAISDGGSGLEDFLSDNFGRVEAVICDFYHVAEYLDDVGKALHGPGKEAEAWCQSQCHRLKEHGGAVVLEDLRALSVEGRSQSAQETYQEVLQYVENQVHRMDYPYYLEKGWQIGSGPVESACKSVIGQRMKGPGMRWGEDGADSLGHLRGLFRSEASQWDAFWNQN
jgi:hypothetical protein